ARSEERGAAHAGHRWSREDGGSREGDRRGALAARRSVSEPYADACRNLARDPVMRALIRRHGLCGLAPEGRSPYEALTRAIAHQQLNGRAARTILGRFVALFGNGRFPTPVAVLDARATTLRRAGFSRAKVRAIKDIARHAVKGVVPTRRACRSLTDDEL